MVRLVRTNIRIGWYRNGVDDIMCKLNIGRYRARDVWQIMQDRKVPMNEAYCIFLKGKDIDDHKN